MEEYSFEYTNSQDDDGEYMKAYNEKYIHRIMEFCAEGVNRCEFMGITSKGSIMAGPVETISWGLAKSMVTPQASIGGSPLFSPAELVYRMATALKPYAVESEEMMEKLKNGLITEDDVKEHAEETQEKVKKIAAVIYDEYGIPYPGSNGVS